MVGLLDNLILSSIIGSLPFGSQMAKQGSMYGECDGYEMNWIYFLLMLIVKMSFSWTYSETDVP